MTCHNCGHEHVELLGAADGHRHPLVTSDAQLLDRVQAWRTLCPQCACVEVHYEPADRLSRFFAEQYDVSDTVQDNLVVHRGQVTGKHELVKDVVVDLLDRMSADGHCLEIACGSGELSRWFASHRPQWQYWGVDPAAAAGSEMPTGGHFVRDVFRTESLPPTPFDVVVAHGFLNRSATLPELRKIRAISRPGTLLSLELITLEQSVFAPHVWDHPYHYLREVLTAYLDAAGFEVLAWHDCVSAWNCLAQCIGSARAKPQVSTTQVERTRRIYADHEQWWRRCAERSTTVAVPATTKRAVFGAGLYSTVLTHAVAPDLDFDLVVDDARAGGTFMGRPVISVADASAAGGIHVLLCTRDRYEPAIIAQLEAAGLNYSRLNLDQQEEVHARQ